MIGIGVVGYGYWGPNLVRNFAETPGAGLAGVCDTLPERLAHVCQGPVFVHHVCALVHHIAASR